jgi:uncharacterized protein with HEPN domain
MDSENKYLSDIINSIELIEDFIKSTTNFSEFNADLKTRSAVERQLSIIGEAVNLLDKKFPDFKLENTRKIVGFRNRLIHAYDSIEASVIWAIIKNHLNPLKEEINLKLEL